MKKEQKQAIQYAGCYALYMMGTSYFRRSYILTKEQEEKLRDHYYKFDIEIQYELEEILIKQFEKEFISQLDYKPEEKEVYVQILLDGSTPLVKMLVEDKTYKMTFTPKSEKNEFIWIFKSKEV